MVAFGGYIMPIQYAGVMTEHRAVRSAAGMFDLSHMGEFILSGGEALAAVDVLMTNEMANVAVGQARYTAMCLVSGGIVDDLLVYRYANHLMLVVNASNIEKDFDWITGRLPDTVSVRNVSDATALIAIQGPEATAIVQELTDADLTQIAYYHFAAGAVAGVECTISRTGYTGEDGVELYADASQAVELWRALRREGEPRGMALVGLGARDTLRLEAGLALYGNDIDGGTTPLEGGLGWTVKLDNRDFVGAPALRQQKADGLTRRSVAFEMLDRANPRPHCPVVIDGAVRGEVTSGTFSPTFAKGLGLAYVPVDRASAGTPIEIDIRGVNHPAQVVKRPIYRRNQADRKAVTRAST